MASPFLQPEWSLEEAVLLVQAGDNIASLSADANIEAAKLSARLRNRPSALGLSFSPRYRNEKEVLLKLKETADLLNLTDSEQEVFSPYTTLEKAAYLFLTNKEKYCSLLEFANEKYPSVSIDVSVPALPFEEFQTDTTAKTEEVAEPIAVLIPKRKKRPRISSYPPVAAQPAYSSSREESRSSRQNEQEEQTEVPEMVVTVQPQEAEITLDAIEENEPQMTSYEFYQNLIRQVIVKNFPNGYRVGSHIELKRFRSAYKKLHGKSMKFKDDVLESYIRTIGFEYDGKVYIPEEAMPKQLYEELEEYILSVFRTGRKYIFFKSLYNKFKDKFIDTQIAGEEMLRLYLRSLNHRGWFFNPQFMTYDLDTTVSIFGEVECYMKEQQRIVTIDELKEALGFLPDDRVEQEWGANSSVFVSNGRNEKFHIDFFYISDTQLNGISNLIATALEQSPFMTGDQLLSETRLLFPELFDANSSVSDLGIRNALANRLGNRFSFRHNLISTIKNDYDGPEAIIAFCKSRGYFTLPEVDEVARIIGSSLNSYLEKIAEVSIRVNETDFIPRSSLKFDTEAIDKGLDVFVKGSFSPISSISNFEALPSVSEYPWNSYLLESYLLRESKKYRLLHPRYLAKEGVKGAIVNSESPIKDYDDLLIQAIGEADIAIEEDGCNQYLYDIGLVSSRRKNGQVKNLLTKAKECRNRINQQRN